MWESSFVCIFVAASCCFCTGVRLCQSCLVWQIAVLSSLSLCQLFAFRLFSAHSNLTWLTAAVSGDVCPTPSREADFPHLCGGGAVFSPCAVLCRVDHQQ